MRGSVDGVAARRRLGDSLPAMLVDDPFMQRFCDGLDAVVAPAVQSLDNFHAYIDPELAPPDFLEWIATWVGIEADRSWSAARTRAVVVEAHRLLRRRGTVAGLADLLELVVGVRPEIVEGGGAAWSRTPGEPLPGTGDGTVVVRLAMPAPTPDVVAKLDALVAANRPAHLVHRIEFDEPPNAARQPLNPPAPTPPARPTNSPTPPKSTAKRPPPPPTSAAASPGGPSTRSAGKKPVAPEASPAKEGSS